MDPLDHTISHLRDVARVLHASGNRTGEASFLMSVAERLSAPTPDEVPAMAARIAALEAALREAEAYIEACLDEADGRAPGGYLVLRAIYAALAPAPAPGVGEVEFRRGLEAAAKMAETQPPMVGEARYWGKEIAGRIRAIAPAPAPEGEPCLDCDGAGHYPSGQTCKSCGGRVVQANWEPKP